MRMSDTPKPSLQHYRRHLLICVGPYCTASGMTPQAVREVGRQLLEAGLLDGAQAVKPTLARCLGACEGGPIMCVYPEASWYARVTTEKFSRILEDHLVGGKNVKDHLFHQGPCCPAPS